MMQLEKGFRTKLKDFVDISRPVTVTMSVSGSGSYECKCWLVDDSGTASEHSMTFTLTDFPASTAHVLFTVNILSSGTMRDISSLALSVNDAMTLQLSGADFSQERAVVVAEMYRKNGEWRFAATAAGFNEGLGELMRQYGASVPPAPSSSRPVELRKGQKVNLEKPSGSGEIIINLNWHKGQSKPGFLGGLFGGKSGAIDLDLGCLFDLKDGTKGSVQALGKHFGSLNNSPYVALDGDDRTGSVEGGENLRVNGRKIYMFRRILVYTFIYEGIANWREADGIVTVKCPGNRDVIVRMDEYDTRDRMCALVMLENVNDSALSVEKLVKFFDGHEQMDRYYNWGLHWVAGRK